MATIDPIDPRGDGMEPGASFPHILDGLRAGDGRAADVVHRRFVRALVALAERRCRDWRLPRADRDGEDLAQSAFKSFFARCGRGCFDGLEGWDEAWRLLVVITLRKCGMRREYLRAARRDVGRLAPASWADVEGREPTPDEAAVLAETVDAWLRELAPLDRSVVELGLRGYSGEEIAGLLGRSERTVRRVRRHVERRLRARAAGEI